MCEIENKELLTFPDAPGLQENVNRKNTYTQICY